MNKAYRDGMIITAVPLLFYLHNDNHVQKAIQIIKHQNSKILQQFLKCQYITFFTH